MKIYAKRDLDIKSIEKTSYTGACTHPAIQQGQDGRWYCTECGQLRG